MGDLETYWQKNCQKFYRLTWLVFPSVQRFQSYTEVVLVYDKPSRMIDQLFPHAMHAPSMYEIIPQLFFLVTFLVIVVLSAVHEVNWEPDDVDTDIHKYDYYYTVFAW